LPGSSLPQKTSLARQQFTSENKPCQTVVYHRKQALPDSNLRWQTLPDSNLR